MIRPNARYRALRTIAVDVMTQWAAPTTGGHRAMLPAGEEFLTGDDGREKAAYGCDPVRREELHADLVRAEDRGHPLYRGYYLIIDARTIEADCEPVG